MKANKARTKEFAQLFNSSMENLKKACEIYVADIDLDWKLKSEYEEAMPHIPNSAWARFEAIGRGILDPELALMNGPGPRRLMSLSISDQKRYLNTPVPIAMKNGTVKKVDIRSLSQAQAQQVFTISNVRSVEEQKMVIKERDRQALEKRKKYEISDDSMLVCTSKAIFTRNELIHIIEEIDSYATEEINTQV